MTSSVRQRRPRPARAKSTCALLSSSSPSASTSTSFSPAPSSPSHADFDTEQDDTPLPSLRPRSHSLFDSTSQLPAAYRSFRASPAAQAIQYGSNLFDSLDLPTSFSSVTDYLLEKMEMLEEGVQRLKELLEEAGVGQVPEGEVERDADGRGRSRDSSPASSRDGSSAQAAAGFDEADAEFAVLEDDLLTLRSFVSSASAFLAALRAELPSFPSLLSADSDSTPLAAFTLSPDARLSLDRFLASHPFPSLPTLPSLRMPHYGVRAKAKDGAAAVLAKINTEMEMLKDAVAYLSTSPSAVAAASYLPTMPSLPHMPTPCDLPDLANLRTHFRAESLRLSAALSHLTADATDSLSTSLHAGMEAAGHALSGIGEKAGEAVEEARRLYREALEAGKTRLLRYEELPIEWRNNEHLLDGYRYIPIESWGRLLKSGIEWHNETVNIQSHFLGFLSLAILLFSYLFSSSPSTSPTAGILSNPHPGDTAIAVLFVLSAMHCLLCSAAWHLLAGCASSTWFRSAACVDYVGISGLIAASVMGAEYYGFYQQPALATGYMIFSALVGVAGMIVPWQAWFNKREYKMWRVAFFCSLAASAIAPIAHRSVIYGYTNTFWFYSPAIPSVVAYLVGLVFYSNQFPECCRPGSWNLGASHQWWHFSIVAAIYLHWAAMRDWSSTVALAELAGVGCGAALGAH
ncbi:hypothetical protein JCM11641_000179 [Rhodosporidiobolus odoratus]